MIRQTSFGALLMVASTLLLGTSIVIPLTINSSEAVSVECPPDRDYTIVAIDGDDEFFGTEDQDTIDAMRTGLLVGSQ